MVYKGPENIQTINIICNYVHYFHINEINIISYIILCTQKFILREVTLTITIHMKYILLPIYNHKSTIG